jgi:Uma2 family endonuclease
MSVVSEPLVLVAEDTAVPTEQIWRLTVEQYHQMIQSGIVDEDDPVELLEGWLVHKMGKNPPHCLSARLTETNLEGLLPLGWYIAAQDPITTGDSEPEPDVAVIRGEPRHYATRHPGPSDVAMVVEVAEATLRRDRGFKKRLYARAKIPVYWIINLSERQVEVYTQPSGPADQPTYAKRQDYGPSDEIPVVIDGIEVGHIRVLELLP